jgi:hypothetical protein
MGETRKFDAETAIKLIVLMDREIGMEDLHDTLKDMGIEATRLAVSTVMQRFRRDLLLLEREGCKIVKPSIKSRAVLKQMGF